MRPNAAVVITHRVVPRLRGGNRADTPPRKRLGSQEGLGQPSRSFLKDDPGKETLPGIRRPTPARACVSIQRQGIGAQLIAPELAVETRSQGFRALHEIRRLRRSTECGS